jgi:hypothetical protein
MYFYGFTVNSVKETMKQIMYDAKDTLGADILCVMLIMETTKEMCDELSFVNDDGAFHWYLVNYSLGEQELRPNDIGALLL